MSHADDIELDPSAKGPSLSSAEVAGPAPSSSTSATSGVEGASGTGGSEGTAAVEANARLESSAEIAAALASGQLDPIGAQSQLIEQALDEQLASLDPATRARVRGELVELLADDPGLGALLR